MDIVSFPTGRFSTRFPMLHVLAKCIFMSGKIPDSRLRGEGVLLRVSSKSSVVTDYSCEKRMNESDTAIDDRPT